MTRSKDGGWGARIEDRKQGERQRSKGGGQGARTEDREQEQHHGGFPNCLSPEDPTRCCCSPRSPRCRRGEDGVPAPGASRALLTVIRNPKEFKTNC